MSDERKQETHSARRSKEASSRKSQESTVDLSPRWYNKPTSKLVGSLFAAISVLSALAGIPLKSWAAPTVCGGDQDSWLVAAFDDTVFENEYTVIDTKGSYVALGGRKVLGLNEPDSAALFIDLSASAPIYKG